MCITQTNKQSCWYFYGGKKAKRENTAKAAKKGVHNAKEYKKSTTNDLTDPRKAKAHSGSLTRAGKLKAIVEYVFNGSRFKLFVPAENCHIMFALENLKSPQPSAPQSVISRGQGKFDITLSNKSAKKCFLKVTLMIFSKTC